MSFETDSDNDDTRELPTAYATGDGSAAAEQSALLIALPKPVNGGTILIAPTRLAAANTAKAPGDASAKAPVRAKAVVRKPAQFGELSSDSDEGVGRSPARAPPSVVRHSAPLSAATAAEPAGDSDSFSLDPRSFAAAVLRGQNFDPAVHTVQPVVHRRGAGGNRLYREMDAAEQREAEAYEREAVRREREAALKKQKAAAGEESPQAAAAQPSGPTQPEAQAISLKSPPSEAMRRPKSARLGEWCRPGFFLKVVDKGTSAATRAGQSMYKRKMVVVEADAGAGADGGVRCAVDGADDELISLGGKTAVETVVGAPDDYGPDGNRRKAPACAGRPHRLALVRVSPTASDKVGDTRVVVRLRARDVKSNRAVVAWRRCTREEVEALSAGLGGVSGWEVTCVRLDDLCDEDASAMRGHAVALC